MKIYKPRKVEFNQLAKIKGWAVKIYTITHRKSFKSKEVLGNTIANLHKWLKKSKTLKLPTYNIAFLIVHEGKDGVWSLINWWIGGEMLQSMTFYTSYDRPDEFHLLPKEGFMSCVWEMPVIYFEREMWIEHVLKKAKKPDFEGYMEKHLNKEI